MRPRAGPQTGGQPAVERPADDVVVLGLEERIRHARSLPRAAASATGARRARRRRAGPSCVPVSTTRPSSRTTMRSALCAARRRWVMTSRVGAAPRSWDSISTSLAVSTLAKTSSSTRSDGRPAERAGHRHALALAAREREAALAHHRVPTLGEARDLGVDPGGHRRRADVAGGDRRAAQRHVVAERAGEEERVLGHPGQRGTKPVQGQRRDVVRRRRRPSRPAAPRAGRAAGPAWTCRSRSVPRWRPSRPGPPRTSRRAAPAPARHRRR